MNHKLSGAIDQPSDDLEAISGIGPTVANRFKKYGIRTFEQVAALTPVQVAELIDHVPARRIIKENWIGQARQLAAKRSGQTAPDHQHYATFTLEFLLDEHQAVRRTQVRHVQSGAGETWANWDEKRLLELCGRSRQAAHSEYCDNGQCNRSDSLRPMSQQPQPTCRA